MKRAEPLDLKDEFGERNPNLDVLEFRRKLVSLIDWKEEENNTYLRVIGPGFQL